MISIIIPVFNAENYLKRCIDSVLRQSYKDYELILIDDGSTDSSADICLDYVNRDNRIKYLKKENAGPGIARLYGVERAGGDYIFFMDSDDYIADDALERLLAQFDSETDCVIGQHKRFGELDSIKQVSFPVGVIDVKKDNKKAITKLIWGNIFGGELWNKLFRKDVIKSICVDKIDFKFGEDTFYLLMIYAQCRKVVCIENTTYFYEFRTNSLARSTAKCLLLPDFVYECLRLENAVCRNALIEDAFPLIVAYMMMLALFKYIKGGFEQELKEDFYKLYSIDQLREIAHRFLKNKKKYIKQYDIMQADYAYIYCVYKSVYKKDIWYYKKLYPAMNDKIMTLKTYIKHIWRCGDNAEK